MVAVSSSSGLVHNWLIVWKAPKVNASELVLFLRNIVMAYGVPETLTTDVGIEYTTRDT